MIALIKEWLVGITCAAMFVALAGALMPEGPVRKIGRLTSGLVLLLAVVQPVLQLDSGILARSFLSYQAVWQEEALPLEDTNLTLMKELIEEQTGAYILDKAASFGIECQVEVTAQDGGEGYYPIPTSVVIHGNLTDYQRTVLTRQLEADLALPADQQHYLEDAE
ncbi:MAG: stage III sporulation protein AF [Oscillospiraceae bacterium]|nr:stage III sporulation protein AF [Oscillospiraceae bacterium]